MQCNKISHKCTVSIELMLALASCLKDLVLSNYIHIINLYLHINACDTAIEYLGIASVCSI